MHSISWNRELFCWAFVSRTWSTCLCCCSDRVLDTPSKGSQVAFPLSSPASPCFPQCVSWAPKQHSFFFLIIFFMSLPDSGFYVILVPFCLTVPIFRNCSLSLPLTALPISRAPVTALPCPRVPRNSHSHSSPLPSRPELLHAPVSVVGSFVPFHLPWFPGRLRSRSLVFSCSRNTRCEE